MQTSLSDVTIYYIDNTFTDFNKMAIFNTFNILDMFGSNFAEDDLIDLILDDEHYTSEEKQDVFMNKVLSKIQNIITEHNIIMSKDIVASLEELNEIAHFLYIVQSLEDYEYLSYRLFAEDEPKEILVDLITHLSLLEKHRILEIIDSVDNKLIEALKQFVSDKTKDNKTIESKHKEIIETFFLFTDNHDSIGRNLHLDGYKDITLEELNNILTYELNVHFDEMINTNVTQVAFNILSILLLCKDTYELPLLMFKKNTYIFTGKTENIIKLEHILINMLVDFNTFSTEHKKNFSPVKKEEAKSNE